MAPLNEAQGYQRRNPLVPKENRKPITREQKAMMVEALYGRKREDEDMTYTLPSQQQQKAAQDAAILANLGFTSEQVEALRGLLGVPPKANMKMPEAFDINNPPSPQPPPGGWPKLPAILHRLNPKTEQNESKIVRTQAEKDHALANGWHLQPQAVIEVDPEPELSQEELIEIHRLDKEVRKKKQAKGSVMVEDGAA